MTIQQLRYAVAISEAGSLNKASEILYVAQPSLTSAARELEKELGVTLFSRSGKGVTPTNDGIEFIHYEDSSQNALWHYMLEYFVRRYSELAKEKLGTEILDTQLAYSIRFYCMGAVGMTQEWVLNDNITSAETVVQMMFASMPETLRKIFFS